MKYFSFSCSFFPDSTSPNLKEIIWDANALCIYLSRMYEFYFPKTRTDGISQLRIHIVDDLEIHARQSLYSPEDIYIFLDWNAYPYLSTPTEKSAFLMDIIQSAIIAYVKDKGWELSSFEIANNKIRENAYRFREYWKKAIVSPDKQHKAQVYFEYDYEKNATFVDFSYKKGNLISRVQFTPTGYSVICESIGTVKWFDDKHVIVYYMGVSRLGKEHQDNLRDYWIVGIDGQVRFHYPRAEIEPLNAHALFNLGVLYWNGTIILQDKARGIELIKQAASMKYKHAGKWLNTNINSQEKE